MRRLHTAELAQQPMQQLAKRRSCISAAGTPSLGAPGSHTQLDPNRRRPCDEPCGKCNNGIQAAMCNMKRTRMQCLARIRGPAGVVGSRCWIASRVRDR